MKLSTPQQRVINLLSAGYELRIFSQYNDGTNLFSLVNEEHDEHEDIHERTVNWLFRKQMLTQGVLIYSTVAPGPDTDTYSYKLKKEFKNERTDNSQGPAQAAQP